MQRPNPIFPAIMVLGLLIQALGCEARRATAAPAPPTVQASGLDASRVPAVEVAPVQPPLEVALVLPGPFVTAGSDGNRASVTGSEYWNFSWTLEKGRIQSGQNSREVIYTVGDTGPVILRCRVDDGRGSFGQISGRLSVVAAPVLEAFEARPAAVGPGGTTNLRWGGREVASLTLDPGGQDVLKVGGLSVQPSETTTYVLRAANLAGTEVNRELVVKVVGPPHIQTFAPEDVARLGLPMTLLAEFRDGKAKVMQGEVMVASSDQSPLRVRVTPIDGSVFTLVVENEAGATATMNRTFRLPVYPGS